MFDLVDGLKDAGIDRFMLPDTLGVLNPLDLIRFVRQMVKRFPGLRFDFHAHNDYDLAISNVLAAVLAGCQGIHTSVNGLGERAGNAPLASVQAILKDQFQAQTRIDESRLNEVSRLVESDRLLTKTHAKRANSHITRQSSERSCQDRTIHAHAVAERSSRIVMDAD